MAAYTRSSNISRQCNNMNLPALISGLTDHPIEDVAAVGHPDRVSRRGHGGEAALVPPERENQNYPEPSRLGVMPASGFFIRHVKNIELHHIDVSFLAKDARPAVVLTDVAGADFQHMNIQRFDGIGYFQLNNVRISPRNMCVRSPTRSATRWRANSSVSDGLTGT